MKNDFVKSVVVLVAIALVVGVLLSVVNQLTMLSEEEQLSRVVKKIEKQFDGESFSLTVVDFDVDAKFTGGFDYLFKVSREGSADEEFLIVSRGKGYKENLQVYCLVKNGIVSMVKIGSNGETAGVGTKAFDSAYLSMYVGQTAEQVNLFTKSYASLNGTDVISGATFSSKGIANALYVGTSVYLAYSESNSEG